MARMSKGDRAQLRFERRQDAAYARRGPPTWKDRAATGGVLAVVGAAVGAAVGGLVSGSSGAGWGAGIGAAAGAVFGATSPLQ